MSTTVLGRDISSPHREQRDAHAGGDEKYPGAMRRNLLAIA